MPNDFRYYAFISYKREDEKWAKFYAFYRPLVLPKETDFEFVQRSVGQLPWRHNILLITQLDNPHDAMYYIEECVKNAWTKDVLAIQIKNNLPSIEEIESQINKR